MAIIYKYEVEYAIPYNDDYLEQQYWDEVFSLDPLDLTPISTPNIK